MKSIYFLFLSGIATFSLNAQLTQANHAPAAGDKWNMWHCDSVTALNVGTAGTGKTWNYSTITTFSNVMQSFTASSVAGNPTYPTANVSVTAGQGSSSYLNSSPADLTYHGGNIAVGMIKAALVYTSPAYYAMYPMNVPGTPNSGPIGGTISATLNPLSGTGNFVGSSTVVADASGTMTLPGAAGLFTNVIRVMFAQDINFTVTVLGSPVSGTVNQVSYEFYQVGNTPVIKAPIFTVWTATAISNPGGTQTQSIVTRNKDAVGISTNTTPPNNAGLAEIIETNIVAVYPNPSASYVNFATDSPPAASISIYDVTGKLVDEFPITTGRLKVDVSGYNSGLYIYSVKTSDKQVLKSGKLTVNH